MPDNKECGDKVVYGNNNGRQPADCVARDCLHITVESVQNITAAVFGKFQPFRIKNNVINICLNFLINPDTDLR